MLTDEDIERIARRLAEFLPANQPPPPPRDFLPLKDAIAFVGKDHLKASEKAFVRWRKKYGVKPGASKGRYSLRALKAGLDREQRQTHFAA